MGKENSSWKIITDEGVAIVKFKDKENDAFKVAMQKGSDDVYITVVGRANINSFKGILTSQLVVMDYEIEVM